jgi:hypothetical protein
MNERIRELESQCWEPRQYGPAWFDSEKFAELIVRECIEQVITGPNGPAYYAVEAALRLKEHFGVEL